MLAELLKKKKPNKDMDPQYKKAKMGVLKEIRDMASGDMGEDLKGLKKVTVASPDEEGLKEGLDKAKEMVSPEEDDDKDMPSDDQEKPKAEEILEEEINHETAEGDMSDEEIDELIQLLESKKSKKM